MTSQDVIHSFYVPAFRIKQDVVPGRYPPNGSGPRGPVLSYFLRGILRDGAFAHGGPCDRDESPGLRGVAGRQARRRTLWRLRASDFSGSWVAAVVMRAIPSSKRRRLEGLFGKPVPLADGRIGYRR